MPRRHALHCIVPPYMLEKILTAGDDALRALALRVSKEAAHERAARAVRATRGRPVRPAPPAPPGEGPKRRIFDARHAEKLPGTPVREEGGPATGDVAADEAYDAAGATWSLYHDAYDRDSLDGQGMPLEETVHYGRNYANAFWNGERMVFGDGDGKVFGRFTADVDIVGHELTHGVIEHEANLVYAFQSGALNESLADVFGILVKQRLAGQDARAADWRVGATVLLGGDWALRSLAAPGTAYRNHPVLGDDPQPATMAGFVHLPGWDDEGGVHLNSGIPNHAFYLAAVEIGGPAWERPGAIWYDALANRLDPRADFAAAARATAAAAVARFGAGSLEARAVERAWTAVGVG